MGDSTEDGFRPEDELQQWLQGGGGGSKKIVTITMFGTLIRLTVAHIVIKSKCEMLLDLSYAHSRGLCD